MNPIQKLRVLKNYFSEFQTSFRIRNDFLKLKKRPFFRTGIIFPPFPPFFPPPDDPLEHIHTSLISFNHLLLPPSRGVYCACLMRWILYGLRNNNRYEDMLHQPTLSTSSSSPAVSFTSKISGIPRIFRDFCCFCFPEIEIPEI